MSEILMSAWAYGISIAIREKKKPLKYALLKLTASINKFVCNIEGLHFHTGCEIVLLEAQFICLFIAYMAESEKTIQMNTLMFYILASSMASHGDNP